MVDFDDGKILSLGSVSPAASAIMTAKLFSSMEVAWTKLLVEAVRLCSKWGVRVPTEMKGRGRMMAMVASRVVSFLVMSRFRWSTWLLAIATFRERGRSRGLLPMTLFFWRAVTW